MFFDTLSGGFGDDILFGGHGIDLLTGDLGADTFLYTSTGQGGDSITDFSGMSGEGDRIDLTALNLDGGGKTVAELIASGYIGVVGTSLFVDVDGGEVIVAAADNTLIATFTDGGGGFAILDDVLV